MNFLGQDIHPLGMGCWPIAGPMFSGEQSLGYTNADDATSIRTIHAALDAGITLFDTAAAYGAGHSERLLSQALKTRPDAMITTKIGIAIDEITKQLTFGDTHPDRVLPAIDHCLNRLDRDRIDLVLLHDNALPVAQADALFDQMERAIQLGKIRAYGWSTDFSASLKATATRPGFQAVQHSMNVFYDVPRIQNVVQTQELTAMIRSPLAMGLLSGTYRPDTKLRAGDVRSGANSGTEYFKDAGPNPAFLKALDDIRDLLTLDGRSLVQGALGWLWAKGQHNIPIPGARTEEQITGIAKALEFGALPHSAMQEIERLIPRPKNMAPEQEL